jgi:uncharacterized metal-binding protein
MIKLFQLNIILEEELYHVELKMDLLSCGNVNNLLLKVQQIVKAGKECLCKELKEAQLLNYIGEEINRYWLVYMKKVQ